jgi:hypothetical protein
LFVRNPVVAISFVVCLIVGALTIQLVRPPDRGPRCVPVSASSVARDEGWTRRFAAYGDGNARLDDWTGADGTWSVRLPDGRTIWIFADTFLGPVQRGPNPRGRPSSWRSPFTAPLISNSAILQGTDDTLTTLRGSTGDGAPAAWIGPSLGQSGTTYWPMSAVLDGGALRVFLQRIEGADRDHPFGIVRRAAVATVPLADLSRPRAITALPEPHQDSYDEQVFYGLAALRAGQYFYVYGTTSNTTRGGHSAYLARVPAGRVADPGEWEYWHGRSRDRGQDDMAGTDDWGGVRQARPVLPYVPGRTGVSAGFSVVRHGGTYVLFTMDPTRPVGGISHIASYWGCTPAGPWHGPSPVYDPPEVVRGGTTYAYFPFAHPEQGGPGLLLSYDVNDTRRVHDDVGLYRPKFIRVGLR